MLTCHGLLACGRLASPGLNLGPPPTIAAVDALWWGARKGAYDAAVAFASMASAVQVRRVPKTSNSSEVDGTPVESSA
jgi:hypothetical protein